MSFACYWIIGFWKTGFFFDGIKSICMRVHDAHNMSSFTQANQRKPGSCQHNFLPSHFFHQPPFFHLHNPKGVYQQQPRVCNATPREDTGGRPVRLEEDRKDLKNVTGLGGRGAR